MGELSLSAAETITAVKDIAFATIVITTATVAIFGLKSWSRELRDKAEFEVGTALLFATHKLRYESKFARLP